MRRITVLLAATAALGVLAGCGSAKLPVVTHAALCPDGSPMPSPGGALACPAAGGACWDGSVPVGGLCPLQPRLEKAQVFYALPRAVVTAEVDVQKTSVKPGRCVAFEDVALTLGLRPGDLVQQARQSVKLRRYTLDSFTEPDPQMIFGVELGSKRFQTDSQTLELSELGLLTGAKATAESTVTDFAVNTLATVATLGAKLLAPAGVTGASAAAAFFPAAPAPVDAADPCDASPDLFHKYCCDVRNQVKDVRKGRTELLSGAPVLGGTGEGVAFRATGLDKLERSLLANFKGESSQSTGKARCTFTPEAAYRLNPLTGMTEGVPGFRHQPGRPLFYFSTALGLLHNPVPGVICTIPGDLSTTRSSRTLRARILDRIAASAATALVQATGAGGAAVDDGPWARRIGDAFAANLETATATAVGGPLADAAARAAIAAADAQARAGVPDATRAARGAVPACPLDPVIVDQAAKDAVAATAPANCDAGCRNAVITTWSPAAKIGPICSVVPAAVPTIRYQPVTLSIDPVDTGLAAAVAHRQNPLAGDRGYYFRVPASGLMSLLVGPEVQQTVAEVIPQFGVVTALASAEAFKSKKASYEVTFFSDSGALRKLVTASSGEDGTTVTALGEALTPLLDAELARRAAEEPVDELEELQRQQAILTALVAIRDLEGDLGATVDGEEP